MTAPAEYCNKCGQLMDKSDVYALKVFDIAQNKIITLGEYHLKCAMQQRGEWRVEVIAEKVKYETI